MQSKDTANATETGQSDLAEIWQICGKDTGLGNLIAHQLAVQPDHEKFLIKSFAGRSSRLMVSALAIGEMLNQIIAPDFEEHAESYKWFCDEVKEEVLNFVRTGKYRHSSFAEVGNSVYHSPSYMKRYMQGLLLSQVFWQNHSQVMDYYVNDFLMPLPAGTRFLEVGPGHGLLSALAATSSNIKTAEAWDISDSSLAMTKESLVKLNLAQLVKLTKQDVTELPTDGAPKFDAIVLSEVLEHLEDPKSVLMSITRCLAPGGKIFINVPVNSPAIDHIYLLESPEEARILVEEAGFDVTGFCSFPATGYTEELARKRRLTLSCVMQASPSKPGV